MSSKEILKEFMLTSAPSGYESEMAYKLKTHLEQYCADVTIDRVGNVIAKVPGRNPALPRAMVFGHMDQLGFIVRKVEEVGFTRWTAWAAFQRRCSPACSWSSAARTASGTPAYSGPRPTTPPRRRRNTKWTW